MSWWTYGQNYIGRHIRAKNHLELKNAQNVMVQNNTFTNNFVGADQLGFMLVLNVRDEVGTAPWATVSNVTVKNNLFQHTAAGVLFMGHDGDGGGTAGSFAFSNNVWLDMGGYGGDGRMYQMLNDVRGITVDHETAFPTGWLMVFAQGASHQIQVTNSIFTAGTGIAGEGYDPGEAAMSAYKADGFFSHNAVISGWPWGFTGAHFSNNLLPGSIPEAGFNNFTGNDVQLTTSSSLQGGSTDGSALGALFSTSQEVQAANALNGLPATDSTNTANAFAFGTLDSSLAPNGWVSIVSKQSGKCLDLATWSGSNWGQAPGTLVTQHGCWGGAMQQFQLSPVYAGYKITVKLSGQQFDMAGGPDATNPGTPLAQWPYWGGTNEIFTLRSSADSWTAFDDGYVTIQPVHSGMCLTVADNFQDDGAWIMQQACSGADNQQWKLVPIQQMQF